MTRANREKLHGLLLEVLPTVYFQPPSDYKLKYPCIIYGKTGADDTHAGNKVYSSKTEYQLTVIDGDPDSEIGEQLKEKFSMIRLTTTFVNDNMYHTILALYY